MKQKPKPSLWWLVAAPLLFLLGAGGGTALLIWQVIGLHKGETFPVPSTQTFNLDEPGTYILWHDHKITFQGKVYNKPESLPDQAVISLKHDGTEIPMRGSWGSGTTSGQHEKKEIGRYIIEMPGQYTLSASGFDEERVFSFGRSGLKGVLWATVACLLLNLLGWFGAPVIIVVVLVQRARKKKELANQALHGTQ